MPEVSRSLMFSFEQNVARADCHSELKSEWVWATLPHTSKEARCNKPLKHCERRRSLSEIYASGSILWLNLWLLARISLKSLSVFIKAESSEFPVKLTCKQWHAILSAKLPWTNRKHLFTKLISGGSICCINLLLAWLFQCNGQYHVFIQVNRVHGRESCTNAVCWGVIDCFHVQKGRQPVAQTCNAIVISLKS